MMIRKICLFIFLVLIAAVKAGADFTKGPYLQLGNQTESPRLSDRITVCWEGDTATTGRVYYGTSPDSLDLFVQDTVGSTMHEVELVGLEPNRLYFYQVDDGTTLSPISYFRTAPEDPCQSFTFAVMGDTRTNHAEHQMVIDMMISRAPDFYIHSGDMINTGSSEAEWQTYFDIEGPLMSFSPLAPVIGNHESPFMLYKKYFSVPLNLNPDEEYYSWDYGNVHFLILNTENTQAAYMDLQNSWIQSDLTEALAGYPDPHFIVVVMHRPVYSNSMHGGDENYPYSTTWGPLFEQAGVAMVVVGHDHCYERFEPVLNRTGLGDPPGEPDVISRGVTYVVSGGGGAPLRDVPPPCPAESCGGGGSPPLDSLVSEKVYHAGLVKVQGGRMDVTFYRAEDGTTLDQFTIIRNKRPVADAGEDFIGAILSTQQMDGSRSSDPEDDPLHYTWTQTAGPKVIIEDADSEKPSFIPIIPGIYTFELIVNDGIDKSKPDSVTIFINCPVSSGDGDDDYFFLCGEIAGGGWNSSLVNLLYLLAPFMLWLAMKRKGARRDTP
jgi:hypothetical protein